MFYIQISDVEHFQQVEAGNGGVKAAMHSSREDPGGLFEHIGAYAARRFRHLALPSLSVGVTGVFGSTLFAVACTEIGVGRGNAQPVRYRPSTRLTRADSSQIGRL